MKNTKLKIISKVLLLIIIVILFYFMFLSEAMGRNVKFENYRYNLVFFKEIKRFTNNTNILGFKSFLINVVGNILAFVPLGILLPLAFDRLKKSYRLGLVALLLSLTIEFAQLISKIGSFDVDDIVLNFIGAMLGYGIYCIFFKKRFKGKRKNEKKKN